MNQIKFNFLLSLVIGNSIFAETCNLRQLQRVFDIQFSELKVSFGKALPEGFAIEDSDSVKTAGASLVGPKGSWVARTHETHGSYNNYQTVFDILHPETGALHRIEVEGKFRALTQSPSGRYVFIATKRPPGGGFGNGHSRFETFFVFRIDMQNPSKIKIFEGVNNYKPDSFSLETVSSLAPMHMFSPSDDEVTLQVVPQYGKIGLLKFKKPSRSAPWPRDFQSAGSDIMAISESGRYMLIEDREIISEKPKTKFDMLWVDLARGNKPKKITLNVPRDMLPNRIENFGPYLISEDGKIAVGGDESEIVTWNLETRRILARINKDNDPSKYEGGLTLSPNGRGLLRLNENTGKLQYFDTRTGEMIYKNDRVSMASLSPSGRFIAFVNRKTSNPNIGIYDVAAGQTFWLKPKNKVDVLERVTDLFFSKDETRLYASDIYVGDRAPTRTLFWNIETN